MGFYFFYLFQKGQTPPFALFINPIEMKSPYGWVERLRGLAIKSGHEENYRTKTAFS
jgi:hypothetical protein